MADPFTFTPGPGPNLYFVTDDDQGNQIVHRLTEATPALIESDRDRAILGAFLRLAMKRLNPTPKKPAQPQEFPRELLRRGLGIDPTELNQ